MSVIRQKVSFVGGGGGVAASSNRAPVLVEREKTYGSFSSNAYHAQQLKSHFREALKINNFMVDCRQQEALDMIASKLARILSGGVNHEDNWLDISGYALLALEAAKEANKSKK